MNLIISDAMHLRRNNVSDDKAFHGQYSRSREVFLYLHFLFDVLYENYWNRVWFFFCDSRLSTRGI